MYYNACTLHEMQGVDISSDLLGWAISRNCPRLHTLRLSGIVLPGGFWRALAPHAGITTVHLFKCQGEGVIRELPALMSLSHVTLSGMPLEYIGALANCQRLTELSLDLGLTALADEQPYHGLASVMQACPLLSLRIPDFRNLAECRSESIRTLELKGFSLGKPHGDAQEFRARFPKLQVLHVAWLQVPNDCTLDQATSRAPSVQRSVDFLAALAQAGVQICSHILPKTSTSRTVVCMLNITGARSLRSPPDFCVDQVLLHSLSPLSTIIQCVSIRHIYLERLAFAPGVMQALVSASSSIYSLTLRACSFSESSIVEALGKLPALRAMRFIIDSQSEREESLVHASSVACAAAQGSRRPLSLMIVAQNQEQRSVCDRWKQACDAIIAALPGPAYVSCKITAL